MFKPYCFSFILSYIPIDMSNFFTPYYTLITLFNVDILSLLLSFPANVFSFMEGYVEKILWLSLLRLSEGSLVIFICLKGDLSSLLNFLGIFVFYLRLKDEYL